MAGLSSTLLVALLAAVHFLVRLLHSFLWVPCPMFSGSVANYRVVLAATRSTPLASFHQYREWSALYDRSFMYWFGPHPRLMVSDPELMKVTLTDSTGAFDKAGTGGNNPLAWQLIGDEVFEGTDAEVCNPSRFAYGNSYHLGGYFPIGIGPTICVGQNLAMVEAKVALAMTLQRFAFVVFPSYVHSPMIMFTLQTQYGVVDGKIWHL
ncbi:cytochrome P450 714C2-like [Phragmites australis]|uniref:cytochrome P450 714C2-like n=1 Tax=Phragmites australis TaxID=29695 RepID=UPI002D78B491|nr:cytochrome P450 714C2-like [Phragmites australis]